MNGNTLTVSYTTWKDSSFLQTSDFYIHTSHIDFLLLLQSALQPLWVMACSTIVEYSQQEGFYRVLLPAARQTPNLEDQ